MKTELNVKLDNKKLQLYRILSEELANGEKRIDFKEIAECTGWARNTVTYNVKLLVKMGVIGVRHKKLYLK